MLSTYGKEGACAKSCKLCTNNNYGRRVKDDDRRINWGLTWEQIASLFWVYWSAPKTSYVPNPKFGTYQIPYHFPFFRYHFPNLVSRKLTADQIWYVPIFTPQPPSATGYSTSTRAQQQRNSWCRGDLRNTHQHQPPINHHPSTTTLIKNRNTKNQSNKLKNWSSVNIAT